MDSPFINKDIYMENLLCDLLCIFR